MEQQVVTVEKTYRLSPAGRRVGYLLLVGCILIWGFALWTLKNTLKIGLRPQNILPSLKLLAKRILGYAGTQPLTAEEAIPAIIMLVLAIVIPLLIWNIVEELRSSYTVGPSGVTFRSWGIRLDYPWTEVAAVRQVDEESEDPLDELVVRTPRLSTIRSGLARFLHWQAYGQRKLPLYSGLEERDDLLARIRDYLAAAAELPAEAAPPSGGESAPAAGAAEPPPSAATGEGQDAVQG